MKSKLFLIGLLVLSIFLIPNVGADEYEVRAIDEYMALGVEVSSAYAVGYQGQLMEPYSIMEGMTYIENGAEYEINAGGRGIYASRKAPIKLKWPQSWGLSAPVCYYMGDVGDLWIKSAGCFTDRNKGTDGSFYTRNYYFTSNGIYAMVFNEVSDGAEFQISEYRLIVSGVGEEFSSSTTSGSTGPVYVIQIMDNNEITTNRVDDGDIISFQVVDSNNNKATIGLTWSYAGEVYSDADTASGCTGNSAQCWWIADKDVSTRVTARRSDTGELIAQRNVNFGSSGKKSGGFSNSWFWRNKWWLIIIGGLFSLFLLSMKRRGSPG